ncbi:MAG: mechanosensitive ion channel [Bacilli bacterium]|nr:mechanosensitive ion channel [Bacilli bacterium]
MNILETFCKYLEIHTTIPSNILYSIILSIIAYLFIKIIKKITSFICLHFEKNSKKRYLHNQKYNIVLDIILILSWYVIWSQYLDKLITIISFVSAALTLALREVVFNFFSGIYIKLKKPFSIEDRIEIDGTIGDVVNINSLSFEVLEVNDKENGEQSTGRIITFPNSYASTKPIKNYVKEFKYIWDEVNIKLTLDSDVKKAKNILYKIINNNEIVKSIPKKMENQINTISLDYRIYFNKLKPIIYTSVVEDHIELTIRFLVHPKKIRLVENDVWLKILECYQKGQLNLYK